jgi:hypothetical protein
MPVKVKIQSIDDAQKGIGIIDGNPKVEESKSLTVGILEKGTVEGQTTLMFVLEFEDGVKVAQCTGNEFEMLYGAFKGADKRFKNGL